MQLRQAIEQNLTEAFRRMQQNFVHHFGSAHQRQAAEFVRRVYGQDCFFHLSS